MLTEHHREYLVPPEEIERRIAGLLSRMEAEDLSLVWVDHLADRLYLTGSAQDGVLLLPARGEPAYFVRKSLERARGESPLEARPHPGRRALLEEARALLPRGERLGLACDVTPAATWTWLDQGLGDGALVDASGIIRSLRAVKSPWEVEQIRRASAQVERLFSEVAAHIRPGMTELDLTGWIEGRLRSFGHGGTIRVRRPGSDIATAVVASGPSALYPTSFDGPVGAEGPYPPTASGAGWRKLAREQTVMLDIVTSHNGYHADTTRTFFLGGRIPDEVQRAHDSCLRVRRLIEDRLRPGAVCAEVYREVSERIRQEGEPPGFMGHGENRVRFFGHGVGLELDELPVLAEKVLMRCEPGTVLAVEPKAFLEGRGPVGIEDTYTVTAEGCEPLCGTALDIVPVA